MAVMKDLLDNLSIKDELDDSGRGLAAADFKTRNRVARMGGKALAKKHKNDNFYQLIGRLGGKARKKILVV